MAFVGGLMPIERPQHLQYRSRSASNSPIGSPVVSPYGSPAGSRRGSVSSITSAKTDPGLDLLQRLRQESTASATSRSSQNSKASTDTSATSKSSLKSLFGRSKKPKEKKDYDKIVLTSRHAAAVKTKLMKEQMSKPKIKTAGISGSTGSAHSSAAAQEARHPHSGPPAIHRRHTADLPMLTRIASGDEQDEEDQATRNQRRQLKWETAKRSSMSNVVEHESDDSPLTSAGTSTDEDGDEDEDEGDPSIKPGTSPVNKLLDSAKAQRPIVVTRNSYGGRFHKDEKGAWKR